MNGPASNPVGDGKGGGGKDDLCRSASVHRLETGATPGGATPGGATHGGQTPQKPLIAVTMGDPGGVGAEVVVKALADHELRSLGRFIIFGLDEMLAYAADRAEINPYWFRRPHEDVGPIESGVVVADYDEYTAFGPAVTRPSAEGGHASLRFVDEAVEAAKENRIDAIVTGPINKISWRMAGCRFPGHTEKLADAFKTPRVTMMFVADRLRVSLATVHVSLSDIRNIFTIGCVFRAIDQLHEALRQWWDIDDPRIAVAGLNPHAGEGGRFGDEEERIIEPAMIMGRQAGMEVDGPFPADTLFVGDRRHRYDGIVAMYHDQGLIPVKMLAFASSVNVTLGLPVIRTSVDHGTAMDIAFKNRANPGSMREALRLACRLADGNRRFADRRSRERNSVADSTEIPLGSDAT